VKKQRMGQCTNFGNCKIADNKETVPMDQTEVCPTCGSILYEVSSSSNSLFIKGGLVSAILVIILGGGWYFLPNNQSPPSAIVPVSNPNGPKIVLEEPTQMSPEEIQTQIQEINGQIEKIQAQIGKNTVQSLTTTIDEVQQQIEDMQQKINNSPEGAEITVLQEQIDEQRTQLEKITKKVLAEKNVPNCLSSVSRELQRKVPVFFVPTIQGHQIPKSLQRWMKGVTHSTINESAFFIMRREVTVEEFQDYVETLNDTQQEKLGEAWQQEDEEYPVASVPWWAATGYADWLSDKTGCSLTLPTYNQWVTASIRYADPRKAVIRDTQFEQSPQSREEKPSGVVDLLGNLREWSIDNRGQKQCRKNSHYLLGEDYKTWRDNIIGEPICESSTLDTIGFRLVMQD
jgi:hypothetical protein